MKVSIVTVVKNDIEGFITTARSVLSQDYANIEWIVIDGLSDDGTGEIVKRFSHRAAKVVIEKDDGIYDAMNKGIELVNGEWTFFMNAGDAFYDTSTVSEYVSHLCESDDVVYSDALRKEDGKIHHYRPPDQYWAGMICDHQTTFVRSELYKAYKLDTSFKIAGDFNFFSRVRINGASFRKLPFVIGCVKNFNIGVSSDFFTRLEERIRVISTYFNEYPWVDVVKKEFNYHTQSSKKEASVLSCYEKRLEALLTKYKPKPGLELNDKSTYDDKRAIWGLPSQDNRENNEIFIVTPSLNALKTIDQAILSVLSQQGNFSIHYHVQDRGSTDGTVDKLKKWESLVAEKKVKPNCLRIRFTWSTEPDNFFNHCLVKGFEKMNIPHYGFMTWLNDSDYYLPGAFERIFKLVENDAEVYWAGEFLHNEGGLESGPADKLDNMGEVKAVKLSPGGKWYHMQRGGSFLKKSLWFKAKHYLINSLSDNDYRFWERVANLASYYQLNAAIKKEVFETKDKDYDLKDAFVILIKMCNETNQINLKHELLKMNNTFPNNKNKQRGKDSFFSSLNYEKHDYSIARINKGHANKGIWLHEINDHKYVEKITSFPYERVVLRHMAQHINKEIDFLPYLYDYYEYKGICFVYMEYLESACAVPKFTDYNAMKIAEAIIDFEAFLEGIKNLPAANDYKVGKLKETLAFLEKNINSSNLKQDFKLLHEFIEPVNEVVNHDFLIACHGDLSFWNMATSIDNSGMIDNIKIIDYGTCAKRPPGFEFGSFVRMSLDKSKKMQFIKTIIKHYAELKGFDEKKVFQNAHMFAIIKSLNRTKLNIINKQEYNDEFNRLMDSMRLFMKNYVSYTSF